MPQLPKDLQTKMSNLSTQINDLFTKSIIGGSKYTVEQTMTEVTLFFMNNLRFGHAFRYDRENSIAKRGR